MIAKDIDEIDRSIISLLQQNPSMTHSDIAKHLNRSQPAIGSRIKKLSDMGILSTQIGVDFKQVSDLNLVKVELVTQKPEEILEMAQCCPFIINTLKLSGEYNIAVFMTSSSLKKIDAVVDSHFRNRDYISKVRVDLITDVAKRFILPVDFAIFDIDPTTGNCNSKNCKFCIKNIETKAQSSKESATKEEPVKEK